MRPCPPRCPTATRPRRTGRLPGRGRGRRSASGRCRLLRARAVLRDALRLLRLQHLHRRRARRRARRAATYADAAVAEIDSPAACSATADLPVETVFFGGGTPTLLPPADLGALLDAVRDALRAAPTAPRSPPRPTPTSVDARALAGAARRRLHPGLVRHAVARCRTCCRRWTARTPRAGAAAPCAWARAGRLRPRQPRPDLRHAGGVRRRLARLAGGGRRLPARPRLGVRADRRGRHPARRAGARAARSPAPDDDDAGRPLRAGRRRARRRRARTGTRCRNWARAGRRSAGTTSRYWRGDDWWGVGPGAHSHVGGVRWWNVRHPAAYADRVWPRGARRRRRARCWPPTTRRVETVLLRGSAGRGAGVRRPRRGGPGGRAALVAEGLVARRRGSRPPRGAHAAWPAARGRGRAGAAALTATSRSAS